MIFLEKMFLMLYPINWANDVAWLLLLLDILGNICAVIICCLDCKVISFEINLKLFYQGQKYNYLRDEKSLEHKIKSFFHPSERVSARSFLTHESRPLIRKVHKKCVLFVAIGILWTNALIFNWMSAIDITISINLNDIVILNISDVDYGCIINRISKNEASNLLNFGVIEVHKRIFFAINSFGFKWRKYW